MPSRFRFYLKQNAIALDQQANALIGGWADETLSSHAWRSSRRGKLAAIACRFVIDFLWHLVFRELNHCKDSFESERSRSHLPPELRSL
jgi:hypothetical protein